YGRGGQEPTVTDCNLVLGRLNPERFLGGELTLAEDAARQAVATRLAEPLGFSGEEGLIQMADGVLSIATVIMAGAIRRVSVEHGLDPRDFVLFSYGGGGPLHASALAHELSVPLVIIPPEPGNFSAIGMLLADARIDTSTTFTGVLEDSLEAKMDAVYSEMERDAAAALKREFGTSDMFFERYAEMRFKGQRHNIKVPVTGVRGTAAIRRAFEHDYKRRYGHADSKASSELQALHLSAFARLRRPDIAKLPRKAIPSAEASTRPVYFGSIGATVDARIYLRDALAPGFAAEGPAIIEEYGSTSVVWPGDRFEIGPMREIRIHCAHK
ncbi:MAG: hydantoinase/oxoprolinase family protein, partial [Alphaproteobacteria bacterium]